MDPALKSPEDPKPADQNSARPRFRSKTLVSNVVEMKLMDRFDQNVCKLTSVSIIGEHELVKQDKIANL